MCLDRKTPLFLPRAKYIFISTIYALLSPDTTLTKSLIFSSFALRLLFSIRFLEKYEMEANVDVFVE